MNTEVMFSGRREDWETPPAVFGPLHDLFGFTLDVCAGPHNAKLPRYLRGPCSGEKGCQCGLCASWAGEVCWMNPPYGRSISAWVKKASQEGQDGVTIVALLPARTDTAWWHDVVVRTCDIIIFIRGRLKFVGAEHSAPFPSAIVTWNGIDHTSEPPVF